jgi:hypothetical protein
MFLKFVLGHFSYLSYFPRHDLLGPRAGTKTLKLSYFWTQGCSLKLTICSLKSTERSQKVSRCSQLRALLVLHDRGNTIINMHHAYASLNSFTHIRALLVLHDRGNTIIIEHHASAGQLNCFTPLRSLLVLRLLRHVVAYGDGYSILGVKTYT